MMREKERDGGSGGERVIVVLDAVKASADKGGGGGGGVAPLKYALRDVVRPKDEILVLTILNSEMDTSPLIGAGCCCVRVRDGRFDQYSWEEDPNINIVHEKMNQRKGDYAQIFRPYYDRCKSSGVKFQVKIAVSFQPQALVVEEANNIDATWVVMDRCFAGDQIFQMNGGAQCPNVALVSSGEVEIVKGHKNLPPKDGAETSVLVQEPKSSNPDKGLLLAEESYSLASTSRECEPSNKHSGLRNKANFPLKGYVSEDEENITFTGFSEVNLVARMPLKLSWGMVEEMTGGFTRMNFLDENASFKSYCGYLSDHHPQVLVKRFNGRFDKILEAEKKAALSMCHKNILGLIGFHKSEYATVLVYPFTRRGTLDKFIYGSKGKHVKLTFQEKMDIAMGIGQGVRYMHEECPRGPIAHGDLQPCNIFLKLNLEPLITGFGKATWLQLKQALPISANRFRKKDSSDNEALALVKSDIFHFGVLLLRLFCSRSAPRDDKMFLAWARPLLLHKVYHELLDNDVEYLDIYGVWRVMYVATQCIKTRLASRPSISQVIALLKGETSCAVQSSPSSSSEGSPNVDLSLWVN